MLPMLFWCTIVAIAMATFLAANEFESINASFGAYSQDVLSRATANGDNMLDFVLITVFAAAVFFFFKGKFNAWTLTDKAPEGFPPKTGPQYFTTRMRYRAWAVLYGAVVTGIFLILVFFPVLVNNAVDLMPPALLTNPLLAELDRLFSPSAGDQKERLWSLGAAIMIAFVFYTSDLERSLRQHFQDRALIPRQAERLLETLSSTIASKSLPAALSKDFLDEFERRDGLPDYHAYELDPLCKQPSQGGVELLPRLEFVLWRLKRPDLSHDIRDRISDHDAILSKLDATLIGIRAEAQSVQGHVGNLVCLVDKTMAEARRAEWRAALAKATAMPADMVVDKPIPFSRLNDALKVLESEVARLKSPVEGGERPTLFSVDENSSAARAIGQLEARLKTLQRMIPICQNTIATLRTALKDLGTRLSTLNEDVLRYVICIGLPAPRSICATFFKDLGLAPRLGHDFDIQKAVGWTGPVCVVYIALVIVMTLDWTPAVAQLKALAQWAVEKFDLDQTTLIGDSGIGSAAGFLLSETEVQIGKWIAGDQWFLWIAVGLFMLLQPLLQGCYSGSAMAYVRQRPNNRHDRDGPTFLEYFASYITIWSVLILGLAGLLSYPALMDGTEKLHAAAFSFSLIPPVWGMIIAAATMRILDPDWEGPILTRSDRILLFWLPLLGILVARLFFQHFGIALPDETSSLWITTAVIAGVLSLVISRVLRTVTKPDDLDAAHDGMVAAQASSGASGDAEGQGRPAFASGARHAS